jgi:prepilin-type N-terminal cleavage/methylation domain-containing protein
VRRGYTIIELLTTVAVLAVIAAVSLRLVFATDRALGGEQRKSTTHGSAAALLEDVSRDLRGATGASGGGEVRISGAQSATYRWSEATGATTRVAPGAADDGKQYVGARVSVAAGGRYVRVTVTSGSLNLQTGVCMRNGG